MDLAVYSKLPFHDIRPGVPLRIEVKNDIYFGPVNQRSFGSILARLGLGLEISRRLDGYWYVGEDKRLRRVALREECCFSEHLDVSVDLIPLSLDELCELHSLLTKFFEGNPDLALLS